MERLLKISKEAGLIVVSLILFTIISAICLDIGFHLYMAGFVWVVLIELLLYVFLMLVGTMYLCGEHK